MFSGERCGPWASCLYKIDYIHVYVQLIHKNPSYFLQVGSGNVQKVGPNLDAIQLSIFSHRFMSIAEQMGRYGDKLQFLPHFLLLSYLHATECNLLTSFTLEIKVTGYLINTPPFKRIKLKIICTHESGKNFHNQYYMECRKRVKFPCT